MTCEEAKELVTIARKWANYADNAIKKGRNILMDDYRSGVMLGRAEGMTNAAEDINDFLSEHIDCLTLGTDDELLKTEDEFNGVEERN